MGDPATRVPAGRRTASTPVMCPSRRRMMRLVVAAACSSWVTMTTV